LIEPPFLSFFPCLSFLRPVFLSSLPSFSFLLFLPSFPLPFHRLFSIFNWTSFPFLFFPVFLFYFSLSLRLLHSLWKKIIN
jgi:hypothetical protein